MLERRKIRLTGRDRNYYTLSKTEAFAFAIVWGLMLGILAGVSLAALVQGKIMLFTFILVSTVWGATEAETRTYVLDYDMTGKDCVERLVQVYNETQSNITLSCEIDSNNYFE